MGNIFARGILPKADLLSEEQKIIERIEETVRRLEDRVTRIEVLVEASDGRRVSYRYPSDDLPIFELVAYPVALEVGYRIVKERSSDHVTVYRKESKMDKVYFHRDRLGNCTFEQLCQVFDRTPLANCEHILNTLAAFTDRKHVCDICREPLSVLY